MNSVDEMDLREPFKMYAISNTPLFLMKRLKADPTTSEIARRFSGNEILDALRDLVRIAPRNESDYVRPYVYLVALARLQDINYLRAAGEIQGTERWDWFRYLQRVLIATYVPFMSETVEAPKVLGFSTVIQNSASEFSTIKAPELVQ